MSESAKFRLFSDAMGLITLAAASGLTVGILFWIREVTWPWTIWLIAFLCLAGASLYIWYGESKTRKMDSDQWLGAVIFTPVMGAVSFAIDVFAGSSSGQHYDSFLHAAMHAGGPFGIVLTVLICPIGTIIALGGWARCLAAGTEDIQENSEA